MKKLLLVLFVVIGLSSCVEKETNPIRPVKNPKEVTTLELIQAQKDTVLLTFSPDSETVYIFNDVGVVQYVLEDASSEVDDTHFWLFVLILFSIVLLFL